VGKTINFKKPHRMKRFQWRRDGTKSEEIIHLTEKQYNALEPLDFRSRPKTSSAYWYANYPYDTEDFYGVRLSSHKALNRLKAIPTDTPIMKYMVYPIIVGVSVVLILLAFGVKP